MSFTARTKLRFCTALTRKFLTVEATPVPTDVVVEERGIGVMIHPITSVRNLYMQRMKAGLLLLARGAFSSTNSYEMTAMEHACFLKRCCQLGFVADGAFS